MEKFRPDDAAESEGDVKQDEEKEKQEQEQEMPRFPSDSMLKKVNQLWVMKAMAKEKKKN